MKKIVLIFLSIICLYIPYMAFSCKRSFAGVDKLTVKELRELDLETIQNLSAIEVQKLTEEQIKLFNSEQMRLLPFRYLLLEQVYAFKTRVNEIISKNTEMQDSDPNIFSLLVRINLRSIYPGNIPLISPKQIRMWEEGEIKKLTVKQVQAFESEQIVAFGRLAEHFSPEQIRAFGEKIQYFLPEQLELFSYSQTGKLELAQLAVLSEKQLQNLGYIDHFIR